MQQCNGSQMSCPAQQQQQYTPTHDNILPDDQQSHRVIMLRMLSISRFTRSRKVKIAISWYFFAMGVAIGNWAALLPAVKEDQSLSNVELGLVLIAAVAGAIASLPCVSYMSHRFGSGPSLFFGGLLLLPLFPVVGISHNLPVFICGVFALGFALGWGDISVNNQAVLCEKMTRSSTLGMFHAIYALGGLTGALIGGALLEQDVAVFEEIVFVCILIIVPEVVLSCWLFSLQEEKLINQTALMSESSRDLLHGQQDHKSSASTSLLIAPELASILQSGDSQQTEWQDFSEEQSCDLWALACLCSLCFLGYLGEGSISDWSIIYFSETLDTSPLASTLGYVCFELAVACTRLASDSLVQRMGRKMLLQIAGVLAACGLTLAASAAWILPVLGRSWALAMGMLGFAIGGLGIGLVAPSVISLAGDVRGIAPADSVGLVSSIGYVGIMAGPPLLGGVSALCKGLEWSFVLDAGLMLLITLLAFAAQHMSKDTLRKSAEQLSQPLLHPDEEDSVIQ